jgi:tetratricopeptide (TPR) repeat protein
VLLAAAGCSRNDVSKTQRLAVLPGNILIADASAEWMRSAVPLVLGQDLSSSSKLIVTAAENESSVYNSDAAEALRTTVEEAGNSLTLSSTLTEISTQRVKRVLDDRSNNLIVGLNSLAHAIDSHATAFSTQSAGALRLFINATAAANLNDKVEGLHRAITEDRSFGLAYIALAQVLTAANDESRVKDVLDLGMQNRASFKPSDRARFELLRARLLRAPTNEQIKAAETLGRLSPNAPDALAALSAGLFSLGRVQEASQVMHRAIEINPQDTALKQALVNGLVLNRKFAEAETLLAKMPPDQATVPQMAFCALLRGDSKRANAVFEKFLSSVSNTDSKAFLSASWLAASGDLGQAISNLGSAKFSDPRLTALSASQLVLWQIMDKQFDAARNSAASANPVAALLASGAPSADAWVRKVDVAADERARISLKGYGLYLFGFYEQAADVWRHVSDQSHGEDVRAQAMLAASLQKAGHTGEASKVRVSPFFPDFNDYYSALSFSALRYVLHQAG